MGVRPTTDTQIIGSPQLDRVAEVRAMTGPDGLVASSIVVAGPDDATPTPVPQPSATPQPTITATPRPGPVEPTEPHPTRLPAPTVTPAPPPTARPVEIEFTGVIDAMGDPQWSIDGTAVTVNAQTELRGNLSVGRRVNVKALRMSNGQLVALSIELINDNPGGNTNDNQNGNDDNRNDNENNNDNKNENHNANENDNHNNNDNRNKNDNHNENDH
jgi:predicted RNA-binding protein with RPS1 domain